MEAQRKEIFKYFILLSISLVVLAGLDLLLLVCISLAAYMELFAKPLQDERNRMPEIPWSALILSTLIFFALTYASWFMWKRMKRSLWPSRAT